MNKLLVMAGACFSFSIAWADVEAVIAPALDNCMSQDVQHYEDAEYVGEFGLSKWRTTAHTNLYCAMSDSVPSVLSNICSYATNQVDRYVLLSAGWCCPSDSAHIDFLSHVLEAGEARVIRRDEVDWFVSAHHDMRLACTLARCYDLPGVSNVVDRYERVTGETNYCNQIRSGEKKIEVETFLLEIETIKCNPPE